MVRVVDCAAVAAEVHVGLFGGASATDPVCGRSVVVARAAASADVGTATYYFCSDACGSQFYAAIADPGALVARSLERFFIDHSGLP